MVYSQLRFIADNIAKRELLPVCLRLLRLRMVVVGVEGGVVSDALA